MKMKDMPGKCFSSELVLRTSAIFSGWKSTMIPEGIGQMGLTGKTTGKATSTKSCFLPFQELRARGDPGAPRRMRRNSGRRTKQP
jgi:hypothetical protein